MSSLFRQPISRVFRRPRLQFPEPDELADVDVTLLPRTAAVAFAARCARSIFPLFAAAWPGASPKVLEGLEHTLEVIESPEDYVIDDAIAHRSVTFLEQVITSSTHAPAANRTARVIQAGYSATHVSQVRELAPVAHELVMHAIRFTDEAVRCCNRPDDDKRRLLTSLCGDFSRLQAFAARRRIEDSDPCSVRMLKRCGVLE